MKLKVLEERNIFFEQQENSKKEATQTTGETKMSSFSTTKYEDKLQLDKKQGKKLGIGSHPTYPIQNLNDLMQKTQYLQGKKTPFTQSIYHVNLVPKIAPNFSVKIEGEFKSSKTPPQTLKEEIIYLDK